VAGGEILYFSLQEQNPIIAQHIRQGGRALVARQTPDGEMVMLLDGADATEVLSVAAIPATLEGRIRVNVENALAAAAAAIAQQVPLETLRTALRSFTNSYEQTPGRFNFIELDGRTVLFDYCHNLHGMQALAEFVQRLGAPHTVAAIMMDGDRSDEHISAFGTLAAQTFDALVIREPSPKYQRGRKRGEVMALLHAAAVAAGLPPAKITLIREPTERLAMQAALAASAPGSLVVNLVDEADGDWRQLTEPEAAEILA
jgi:cyanophycin synthetase